MEDSDERESGSSESESEGEESDTASEQSEATPVRDSEKEEDVELVDSEEGKSKRNHLFYPQSLYLSASGSRRSKSHRKKKKHHHKRTPSTDREDRQSHEESDDHEGRWRDEERPAAKAPSSRGEHSDDHQHLEEEEEDEEDSRLEAALRGELKDKPPTDTAEGTPRSQDSFADGINEKEPEAAKESKEQEQEEQERLLREKERDKLPPYLPSIYGCRNVEEFQCLNRIEEGTYGVVYRAKDKKTSEIVALKRLKMEREKEGFPITSLREINTLLISQHENVVTVREIVVGSNMDKIFIGKHQSNQSLRSSWSRIFVSFKSWISWNTISSL